MKSGNGEICNALVTADPGIIHRDLGHGLQPIMEAVLTGRPAIAESLLQQGSSLVSESDTNGIGSRWEGAALVSAAAHSNRPRITEALLAKGAAWQRSGALHQAAAKGSLERMAVLVKYRADRDERHPRNTEYGEPSALTCTWTPMHYAASKGQVPAMTWLEEHGADPQSAAQGCQFASGALVMQ